MQDTRTGDLVPLADLLQDTKDKAVPRQFQGPVLTVGEIIDVKGGKFRVAEIRSRGRLYLKGVPS